MGKSIKTHDSVFNILLFVVVVCLFIFMTKQKHRSVKIVKAMLQRSRTTSVCCDLRAGNGTRYGDPDRAHIPHKNALTSCLEDCLLGARCEPA